jgi:hypothetical protein
MDRKLEDTGALVGRIDKKLQGCLEFFRLEMKFVFVKICSKNSVEFKVLLNIHHFLLLQGR